MKKHLLIVLAIALMLFAAAPTSQACDGHGYGYGWGMGSLYQSLHNRVPHFAAHPPVYYSYPVPRTYGYSPFAYPPHVMTPDVVGEVEPLEIINPYVPSSGSKEASGPDNRTAARSSQPEPLVIENPFVKADRAVAQSAR